jgi:outer membrane biosynthesis protein TonB
MGRFTGVVVALALVAGCAAHKSKEMAEPNSATGGRERGANDTADEGGGGKQGTPTPVTTPPVLPPGGGSPDTAKPLDPSANADPNTAKQQARANGMLGNTDHFDDSPIKDTPEKNKGGNAKHSGESKVGGSTNQPVSGQNAQAQVAFQLDTPDAAVKTAIDAQRAAITGCRKAGTGVLEIAITVDAAGKVTSAKIAASSTFKDATTRDCVLAIVKKLELGKGAKITAPLRFTFN